MAQKDAIETVADEIVKAIDKELSSAAYDKSSAGVIISKDGEDYTVQAFGGTYKITSEKTYSVGQAVVVTALQGNMSRLVISEGNSDVQLSTGVKLNELSEDFKGFVDDAAVDEELIQKQIDGSITTWYYNGAPSATTYPTKDWTTDEAKASHEYDIYFDRDTKYCYRWLNKNGTYQWVQITDNSTVNAIAAAGEALDTADNKRRVFYVTPTPPYDVGDLWVQGTADDGYDGEIMRCCQARDILGVYYETDWERASKYTDDTKANEVASDLTTTKETYNARFEKTDQQLTSQYNYIKEVESNTSSEITNLSSSLTQTAGEIRAEVAGTKTEVQNYADTAATNAKDAAISDTTEKLKSYSTTTQMNSAIDQKADEIKSTVSSTTTELKEYADTAATNAKDAANASTDEKLKSYTLTSTSSEISQKADSIAATVSSIKTSLDPETGEYVTTDNVRTKFAMDTKDITLEATSGSITFKTGSLIVHTDPFVLDKDSSTGKWYSEFRGTLNVNDKSFYVNTQGDIGAYGSIGNTQGLYKGITGYVPYKSASFDQRALWFCKGLYVGNTDMSWGSVDGNTTTWDGKPQYNISMNIAVTNNSNVTGSNYVTVTGAGSHAELSTATVVIFIPYYFTFSSIASNNSNVTVGEPTITSADSYGGKNYKYTFTMKEDFTLTVNVALSTASITVTTATDPTGVKEYNGSDTIKGAGTYKPGDTISISALYEADSSYIDEYYQFKKFAYISSVTGASEDIETTSSSWNGVTASYVVLEAGTICAYYDKYTKEETT